MAGVGAAESLLEAELSCPVCLTIYQDPVSLGCGHCFCRRCITEALCHQGDQGRSYTCPMCQAEYQDFPQFQKNLQLCSIVENYLSIQKSGEDDQIACGDCLDEPSIAVKTCVSCEVSLCQKHVERHIRKSHILLEPTDSVQERKCPDHDKLLEYYCDQDASCICVTCYIAGSHKGHNIMTLKEAHEKHLTTLSEATSTFSATVVALCKDIEDLHAGLAKINENTVKLSKPLEDLCERIVSLVQGQFKEIGQTIISNQSQTTSQITAIIKQMEDAKATTENTIKELNILSKQPDDLLFMKEFNKSQALIKQQSPRINTVQVVDVEADKAMIKNVDKETSDYIDLISQHLKHTHSVLSQQIEALVWSGAQRNKVQSQRMEPVQIRRQGSEKINLSFNDLNTTHCSYQVIASNLLKTITANRIKLADAYVYGGYALNRNPQFTFGLPNPTPSIEQNCKCGLPVILPNVIMKGKSSGTVYCLVDVCTSNDWCVGIISTKKSDCSYLKWNGNCLSYESSGTSLNLGICRVSKLKMQLDFDNHLLGFYDVSSGTEMSLLICKCAKVFGNPLNVGFNILQGSLTLI